MALGGLERAEHRLLAGHARGVSQALRLRRGRREARAAHGAGRRAAIPPGPAAPARAAFLRDFLEHCLRGKNYATGKTGSPLDFIAFHAKGAPRFVEGNVLMGIEKQLGHRQGLRDRRALPGAEGHGRSSSASPTRTAAPPAPRASTRRTPIATALMYASYTGAVMPRQLDLAAKHGVNFWAR